MEDKIEIGEYVKDKAGVIDKIVGYFPETNIYFCENEMSIDPENKIGTHLEDIKHSKNIIDLIEVGDYVNGFLIMKISRKRKYFTIACKYGVLSYEFQDIGKLYKIKSIVTKEQFKSIEYKVEG